MSGLIEYLSIEEALKAAQNGVPNSIWPKIDMHDHDKIDHLEAFNEFETLGK